MRIAIDARLNAYRQGGISQYTRQLLIALAEVSSEDQFVSFQHRDQLRPLAIAPNVVRRTALTPPHHRFEPWTLPLEVLLARPDVLHCPDFIAPLRRPCPAVVTIHDLAFMHYPEILDDAASAYYSQVKTNAPRADAIIAVSEATRQDISQYLDIPIEQIDVIYEAAAPLYSRLALREGEARVLNATPVAAGTFMLFVSTLEPRKNLPTLLQALRICIDRRPDADYQLVVVGRRGWRDDAIFAAVRDLQLGDHVLFAGGVGQYDLRWLYNACRLYVNPSLYEGFGLPLLEAMACGAACLAAATSSLPEIGGPAAIYVPPLEADQWADEIEALWDDEERRAELGRLGLARAAQFSWLRAARETLKVYRRAAERIVPKPAGAPAPDLAAEEIAGVVSLRSTALSPADPRACLRCGATMLAGELQHGIAMRAPELLRDGRSQAPRAWACPQCGHVELVVDWAALADLAASAPPPEIIRVVGALAPIVPIEFAQVDQPAEAPASDAAPANLDTVDQVAAGAPFDTPGGDAAPAPDSAEDERVDPGAPAYLETVEDGAVELAQPVDAPAHAEPEEAVAELAAPDDLPEQAELVEDAAAELAQPVDAPAHAEPEQATPAEQPPAVELLLPGAPPEQAELVEEAVAELAQPADPPAHAEQPAPNELAEEQAAAEAMVGEARIGNLVTLNGVAVTHDEILEVAAELENHADETATVPASGVSDARSPNGTVEPPKAKAPRKPRQPRQAQPEAAVPSQAPKRRQNRSKRKPTS
ncbi:MAG TPA: glycosyltransferase [Roseiflexaceae bacterium]